MSERQDAETALKQAARATKRGDLTSAERWSKTAERLAAAADRIAALPPPVDPWEEDEKLREELRGRLERLAEASKDWRAFEIEKAVHDALIEHGITPPPLRPNPDLEAQVLEFVKGLPAG